MNMSAIYSFALVMLLASGSAHAEQLSCSNSTVQDILTSEARKALLETARGDPQARVPEDEFLIGFKDAYETGRSEFTRDCSATLLSTKDLSDPIDVEYTAIQTESGNFLVKWAGQDGWAKAAYVEIVMKTSLNEIRRKHPDLSKEEQYKILLYGEPGEPKNSAADIARGMAAADPTQNVGVGLGSTAAPGGDRGHFGTATTRSSKSTPTVPYAADPNWSQWRR